MLGLDPDTLKSYLCRTNLTEVAQKRALEMARPALDHPSGCYPRVHMFLVVMVCVILTRLKKLLRAKCLPGDSRVAKPSGNSKIAVLLRLASGF